VILALIYVAVLVDRIRQHSIARYGNRGSIIDFSQGCTLNT